MFNLAHLEQFDQTLKIHGSWLPNLASNCNGFGTRMRMELVTKDPKECVTAAQS